MGDDTLGPSWRLRWVSSSSSLSWSVAWWYTFWPRVIIDSDNPRFVTLVWADIVTTIFFIDTTWWCHYQPGGPHLCGASLKFENQIIISSGFFCHQASKIDVNALETVLLNSGGYYQLGVLSSVCDPNSSLALGVEAGIEDDVGDWSNWQEMWG